MPFYQLYRSQKLKVELDELWNFISSPSNLKEITPDYMGFDITTSIVDKMYPGMIIGYRVSPLLNFKTNWLTEITHIRDKNYFVDEQRIGPYRLWHHQHIIEPIAGGTLMKDIVTYQPPFGLVGALFNSLIIERKLNEIFDYRKKILTQRFGSIG